MKIAVTSSGEDLNAEVDPRFGRCAHFLIIDPESMAYRAVTNSQNLDLPQGAGIQAAKTVVQNKADILITGNCGPKAFKVLEAAGVKVIVNVEGRVTEVIERFKDGKLEDFAKNPNVEGHWI
jgi:predicted Fe-Mo cluster-binding NifX family protein